MYELKECGRNPFGIYEIHEKDTAATVGAKYEIPPAAIITSNRLKGFPLAGGMIVLPEFEGKMHIVEPGETVATLCKRYGMSEEEFIHMNGEGYIYPTQRVCVKKSERYR